MASNKFIQALVNSGADAFNNMYDVVITAPGAAEPGQTMTVRASGFQVPDAATDEYEISYHGNKISKPKPNQVFDRKFSLEFRMDAAFSIHDFFLKWESYVVNPTTGGVANVAPALGKVVVRTINTPFVASGSTNSIIDYTGDDGTISQNKTREWTFEDVWVQKVGQPQFTTEGSDVLKFTVDFRCGNVGYPGY